MRKRIVDLWFSLDPRSLGAFRILLALLLLRDWIGRWPNLEAFYASSGVLPLDAPLPRVGGAFHFSLLDVTDSLPLVRVIFLLGLVFYLLLLVGWRTKLAQVASFLFFASLRTRNPLLSQGGDVVLVTWAMWSLFLPLGARWSVDAARAALRRGVVLRDREKHAPSADDNRPHRSLAAFAILFQIGLIYLVTAAAKTGLTWRDGTAVYYALQLDSLSTPLGLWVGAGPLNLLKVLTWGTLILEWLAMPLIFLPVAQPWLRRLAIVGLGGFHLGTVLTMTLGAFPFCMLASYVLLILPEDWDRLGRWAQRFARPVVAYFDDTCGFCHWCCQLWALADRGHFIEFIGASARDARWHPLRDDELASSLVVFEATTGRKSTRAAAVAALFGALPLPYHVGRVVALPGIVTIANLVYDFVAQRRHAISRRMGFTACGIDRVTETVPTAAPSAARRPVAARLARGFAHLLVAALLCNAVLDSWNHTLARFVGAPSLRTPTWTRAPNLALDLAQSWRMFAPNPSRRDGWWIAAARSPTGGSLDLLTSQPTRWEKPARMADQHDVFWDSYLHNISQPHSGAWQPYYARWLVRRAEREGFARPLGFDLYFMQEDSQPPGSPRPFPVRRLPLWSYDAERDSVRATSIGPTTAGDAVPAPAP